MRSLRKSPAFSLVSIGILTLGIGASTAIFSVVNALILSPLAYADANRVMQLRSKHPQQGLNGLSPATFVDVAKEAQSFETVGAQTYVYANLTKSGPPTLVTAAQATPDYFKLFGVAPLLGRTWSADETKSGAAAVAVIGERLWRRQYGARDDIIGFTITIDEVPHTVIGVMPASFKEPWENAEVWRPMMYDSPAMAERAERYYSSFARLKRGVTVEQANAELGLVAERLEKNYPAVYRGWTLEVDSLQGVIVGPLHRRLLVVLGAVGCVLLITCANLAGLSVIRTIARRKELAIRVALGAARSRLVRDQLGESLFLAAIGGALGILLGKWLLDGLLAAFQGGFLPRANEVTLNFPVFAAATGLALLTGALFGLVPALTASRVNAGDALKDQSRGSAGPVAHRLRSSLVITELALAVVLLVSAALLGRNFLGLLQKKTGIDARQLLSLTLMPSDKRYDSPDKRRDFYTRALAEVSGLPGVVSAAFTQTSPFRWGNSLTLVPVPRDGIVAEANVPQTMYDSVSAEYFRTVGGTLLHGRYFNASDDAKAKPVLIISESAARRFFGADDPVGREMISAPGGTTRFEIVGVVSDIRRNGVAEQIPLQAYRPLAQRPTAFATLMVRTAQPPTALAKSIQAALWRVDGEMPISDVAPMDQVVSRSMAEPRLYLTLFGAFALLALLLAGIGLYSLIAYSVAQRTREFGIRAALGAAPRELFLLVLREGGTVICLGLLCGLVVSAAVVHLMKQLLFETSVHDPLVFVAVPAVLGAIALLACLVPARRATRVNPLTALRAE